MPYILGETQIEADRKFTREDLLLSPKIKKRDSLVRMVKALKMSNPSVRIGFTNGKYRLLHAGHAVFLNLCKTRCNFLIVGVNSELSLLMQDVPTTAAPLDERSFVLAQLSAVDFICYFDEKTPENLIKELDFIDVVFKGPDYSKETVVSGGRSIEIIEHPLNSHVSDLEKGSDC